MEYLLFSLNLNRESLVLEFIIKVLSFEISFPILSNLEKSFCTVLTYFPVKLKSLLIFTSLYISKLILFSILSSFTQNHSFILVILIFLSLFLLHIVSFFEGSFGVSPTSLLYRFEL